jgi:hypothetical protein
MASNITYPDKSCLWFIEGDRLAVISNVDSSGNTRTTSRKQWKAIPETIKYGMLLHYWSEPDSVTSISSVLDVDNTLHSAVVNYVKCSLYMDRAGMSQGDAGAVAMSLSREHRKLFDRDVRKYGQRKNSKTGGLRSLVIPDLR